MLESQKVHCSKILCLKKHTVVRWSCPKVILQQSGDVSRSWLCKKVMCQKKALYQSLKAQFSKSGIPQNHNPFELDIFPSLKYLVLSLKVFYFSGKNSQIYQVQTRSKMSQKGYCSKVGMSQNGWFSICTF